MKNRFERCAFFLFLAAAFPLYSYASVDFHIYPNSAAMGLPVNFADIEQTQRDIAAHPNSFFSKNGEVIPYGMSIVNTMGYPNGKSIIGEYPHFETGLAVGAGVYKYDRADNFAKDNPTIPGGGANAGIHFGTGLNEDMDITGKLFASKGFYGREKTITKKKSSREYEFSPKDCSVFSVGAKVRYRVIKEKEILSSALRFGGITAGISADYMYGELSATGHFFENRTVPFSITDPMSGDTVTSNADVNAKVYGNAKATWNILSVTPEAFAYLDLLYLFSFYTGPSVSLSAGSVDFFSTNRGTVVNTSAISDGITEYVAPNTQIATGDLIVNERMWTPFIIPKWVLGLEINLAAVKIQLEAASILTSPANSFTLQAGIRAQF